MKKPTLGEVKAYWAGVGPDGGLMGTPDEFYDHFVSNGWKVGRNPMKDWRAAARNWSRNEVRYGRAPIIRSAKERAEALLRASKKP